MPKSARTFLGILAILLLVVSPLFAYDVVLKDGSVIHFQKYRATETALLYIDDQGKEISIPLTSVDLDRTRELNAKENPPLNLPGLVTASSSANPDGQASHGDIARNLRNGGGAVPQESLADAARRVRAEKEQRVRQHKTVDVYKGFLNFKAIPKFSDTQRQLVSRMEIQILNSSTLGYRYALTAKCGEWSKELSGNIESSPHPPYSREKTISLDLPSPCGWSYASLENVREAEGLEGPEPQPSKVPGIDDAELARRAKIQEAFEEAPRISISELQRRVDEACKRQSLADLATAPVSGIGDHMTACAKAQDDLAAALRVQGETQAKARTEAMNKPAPSGVVLVRLTGTTGLPFTGNCSISNRAGGNSKSYDDVLPFEVTVANADSVNCSFSSKSDFRYDLKLEILKDGRVIGESDTNAPYGLVSVYRDIN
jgi:hypothetical protein